MVARYSASDSEDHYILRMFLFFPEADFSTFSADFVETLPSNKHFLLVWSVFNFVHVTRH